MPEFKDQRLQIPQGFISYADSTISGSLNVTGVINTKFVQGVLSGDQSITNNLDTQIQFIDQYDPNGWLTSYDFKPTIAGYYDIFLNVLLENPGVTNNQANIQFSFNATSQILLIQQVLNNATNQTLNGGKIVYLNGTTDFIRFTIFHGSGGSKKILQSSSTYQGTWFYAKLLSS